MKKKIIYVLLITLISMFCIGCGNNQSNNGNSEQSETNKDQSEIDNNQSGTSDNNSETENSKHEHTYVETIVEATCTANGSKTYKCSSCNDTYSETIPAVGHSYAVTNTVNATCTSNGSKTYTCSSCSDSYSEAISATGHSYKITNTVNATCTENGASTYTCSSCSSSYAEPISATGHADNGNGNCGKCGVQLYAKEYNYDFSVPEDYYCSDYYKGTLAGFIDVTEISATVNSNKNNPAIVTVSMKITKSFQAITIPVREHHLLVILKDFNGNVIGQKDVVSKLQEDESGIFSVQFQVSPGSYIIEIATPE